jgi:hypothetical protein
MTGSSTVSGSVEEVDSTITRNNDGVEMENEEPRPKRAKRKGDDRQIFELYSMYFLWE